MKIIKLLSSVVAAICCILLGYWLAMDKSPNLLVPKSTPKINVPEIPVSHEVLLPIVIYTPWPRPTQMDITTNKQASRWLSSFPHCNLRGFILARRPSGESIAMVSKELLIDRFRPELFKKLEWKKHHEGETAIAVIGHNPIESQGFPLVGKLEEGKSVKVISAFFTITSEPAVATWSGFAKPTKFPGGYSLEADTRSAIQLSSKLVGTGVYDGDRVVGIITKSAVAIQEGAMMSPILIQVEPIPE